MGSRLTFIGHFRINTQLDVCIKLILCCRYEQIADAANRRAKISIAITRGLESTQEQVMQTIYWSKVCFGCFETEINYPATSWKESDQFVSGNTVSPLM